MEQSKKNESEKVQISDLAIDVIWDTVLKGVANGSIQDPEKTARNLVDARRFLKGLLTEQVTISLPRGAVQSGSGVDPMFGRPVCSPCCAPESKRAEANRLLEGLVDQLKRGYDAQAPQQKRAGS